MNGIFKPKLNKLYFIVAKYLLFDCLYRQNDQQADHILTQLEEHLTKDIVDA